MAQKKQATETVAKSGEAVTNAIAELQKVGFGSVAWMGTAWTEQLTDFGAEMLSFVAERVKEDVKTQHKILHCKNVGELQQIQAQFIQKAVDQYSTETGKLVALGSAIVEKAQSAPSDENNGHGHATPI